LGRFKNEEPLLKNMVLKRIPSGTDVIEHLLGGGYETDIITTIYGPAGSGKTNLALLAAISIAKGGKKVIYIDTEGGFSVERLKQLTSDSRKILENILFLKPTKFSEQKKAFEKLKDIVNKREIGLIVVDTIAMLYRLELGKNDDVYDVNRELGKQIAYLTEIARKKNIPIIVTNQVYSNFDERDKIRMVGGDIIKYGSKCLVELQNANNNKRVAILKKHRSLPQEKQAVFEIKEKGLKLVKQSRGFKLF
jgi:DNA repair protein RadB